jgi:hypothetical protein
MLFTLALLACADTGPDQDSAALSDSGGDCECPPEELQTFWLDADGDGYGDDDSPVEACEQPADTSTQGGDCDDLDASVSPEGSEVCNGVDEDCDGDIDEDASDALSWYADADGDGFGDPDSGVLGCEAGSGEVEDSSDCDDTDALVFPGSSTPDDPASGLDGDCDGEVACLDANCDGLPDLVLGGEAVNSVGDCGADFVYFGDGGDYSGTSPDELDNDCTWQQASADLNQDGYPELISVIRSQGVEPMEANSKVYWGSASGWTSGDSRDLPTTGASGLIVQDLNDDGWLDLGFSESGTGGYSGFAASSTVYWGSSAGFGGSTDLSTYGAWEAAAGDLDSDGYVDLVYCNSADDSGDFTGGFSLEIPSYIFWGSSGGYSDSDKTELPTLSCRGVAIADLDQDGLEDLVFANSYSNTTYIVDSVIYWNSASGFDEANTTGLPTSWSYDVVVGDWNGDGWEDLAFASGASSDTSGGSFWSEPSYVYWNQGGTFDPADVTALNGDVSFELASADLDGDGYDELVVPALWSDAGTDTTSRVYWGGADGFASTDLLSTYGPGAVSIGDLDADGHPELLFPAPNAEVGAQIFWGSSRGYDDLRSTEVGDAASVAGPLIVGDSSW